MRDADERELFTLLVKTGALQSYGAHSHGTLYRCERCCKNYPTIQAHHIVPRARGGSHAPSNGAALCFACHREVHDHIGEWRRWLRRKETHCD